MRLLVTGGCGFIGANYVLRVLRTTQDTVVNLDKLTYAGNPDNLAGAAQEFGDRYTFVRGDIGNQELVTALLAGHRIDAIVNFAAETHVDRSIHDPAPFLTTNVMGTQVLLECARLARIRMVHVSTDEVYGTLESDDPAFSESTPLAPNSPYSASKASADMLARAYFETYGLDVAITRCSNNYGPFQFPEKLIPLMYLKAKAGDSLPIYGDGSNIRDWIWVDDHCLGVDLTLRKGKAGEVYNFGGAAERTNLQVVKAILSHLDKPESLITYVTDRPGHDKRYAMDFEKAQRDLGFAPTLDFETGLEKTLRWYADNEAWLQNVQSGAYHQFMDAWYQQRKGE